MIWLGFSVVLGVLVALRSYHAYTHFCERASTLHQAGEQDPTGQGQVRAVCVRVVSNNAAVVFSLFHFFQG